MLTKVPIVKAMVLPVVVYGCESWTMKKVERRRVDAFELWCWPEGWRGRAGTGLPLRPGGRADTMEQGVCHVIRVFRRSRFRNTGTESTEQTLSGLIWDMSHIKNSALQFFSGVYLRKLNAPEELLVDFV